MKAIGGFFELELRQRESLYHNNSIKLSTGRACLNYILKLLKPSKVFLPFYCCNALYEPILLNGIQYEFYPINKDLEISIHPKLKTSELLLYCDFFGIKTHYVNTLLEMYSQKLIIDNTHSFFHRGYATCNFSFTSARKYFGVPDGAFLYGPKHKKPDVNIKRNRKISIDHNLNRLLGFQEKAYSEHVEYEKNLNSDLQKISIFSEKLLTTINYSEVRKSRNNNFNYFREEFSSLNKLYISKDETDCFCYPLLLDKPIVKKRLYEAKIFIPNLWLDVINRKQNIDYTFECKLSKELLPLPIDHRYSIDDLQRINLFIKTILHNR